MKIDALPNWLQATDDELVVNLFVYAQPGAKAPGIIGEHSGSLKIKISSPPVDGAANEALICFIAQKLGIKLRDVSLVHGKTSRKKTLQVLGLRASDITTKLLL